MEQCLLLWRQNQLTLTYMIKLFSQFRIWHLAKPIFHARVTLKHTCRKFHSMKFSPHNKQIGFSQLFSHITYSGFHKLHGHKNNSLFLVLLLSARGQVLCSYCSTSCVRVELGYKRQVSAEVEIGVNTLRTVMVQYTAKNSTATAICHFKRLQILKRQCSNCIKHCFVYTTALSLSLQQR